MPTAEMTRFPFADMATPPGRPTTAAVLIADSMPCRASLIRALCIEAGAEASVAGDVDTVLARVAEGCVDGLVLDRDLFGDTVLRALAASAPAFPLLLTVGASVRDHLDALRAIYRMGLTQVTVTPRRLTTEALRRFLADVSPVTAERYEAVA